MKTFNNRNNNLNKLGIEATYLDITKGVFDKPTTIILNNKGSKMFV